MGTRSSPCTCHTYYHSGISTPSSPAEGTQLSYTSNGTSPDNAHFSKELGACLITPPQSILLERERLSSSTSCQPPSSWPFTLAVILGTQQFSTTAVLDCSLENKARLANEPFTPCPRPRQFPSQPFKCRLNPKILRLPPSPFHLRLLTSQTKIYPQPLRTQTLASFNGPVHSSRRPCRQALLSSPLLLPPTSRKDSIFPQFTLNMMITITMNMIHSSSGTCPLGHGEGWAEGLYRCLCPLVKGLPECFQDLARLLHPSIPKD